VEQGSPMTASTASHSSHFSGGTFLSLIFPQRPAVGGVFATSGWSQGRFSRRLLRWKC
jgi:hypothetical protein